MKNCRTVLIMLLPVLVAFLFLHVNAVPSPIAFWPFTEKTGLKDLINSITGNYNNSNGSPSYDQGPDGSLLGSLTLGPGDSDYVSFSSPLLRLGNTSWTIAVYFKSYGFNGPILEYVNSQNPSDSGFHIWANSKAVNQLYSAPDRFGDYERYFNCTMATDWQFIAITYYANLRKYRWFCQDHFAGAIADDDIANTVSGTFNLGKRFNNTVRSSQVACLSIYNESLTSSQLCEVKWSTCLQKSVGYADDACNPTLLAYWPLASWSGLRGEGRSVIIGKYNASRSESYDVVGPNNFHTGGLQLGPQSDDFPFFQSPLLVMPANQSWTYALYFNSSKDGPMLEYSGLNGGMQIWAQNRLSSLLFFKTATGYYTTVNCSTANGWVFVAIAFAADTKQYSIFCEDRWISHSRSTYIAETSSGYFALGKRINSTVQNAQVACLSIFKTALSSLQLCDIRYRICRGQEIFAATDLCRPVRIGYYPFSSSLKDLSFGFFATMGSPKTAPLFTSTGPSGLANTALTIGPGDTDFVKLYNRKYAFKAFSPPISWAISLYYNSFGLQQTVLSYNKADSTSCCGLRIVANYPNANILYIDPGNGDPAMQVPCQLTCWQFIALIYNHYIKEYNVYCNEMETTFSNINNLAETTSGQMRIGKEIGKPTVNASVFCFGIHLSTSYNITAIDWTRLLPCLRESNGTIVNTCLITSTTALPTTTPNPEPTTNLVENPVETIQKYYPANIEPETSVPLMKVEDLLLNCSDFAASRIAPPNNGLPTSLMAAFAIERLVDFDDVAETLTVDALFFLHWQVTTCQKNGLAEFFRSKPWAKPSGRHRLFVVSKEEVWLPTYLFLSSVNDIYMNKETFGDDLTAFVKSNLDDPKTDNQTLDFYFIRRGFFAAKCPLYLTRFPFDSVTCDFTFSLERALDQIQFGLLDVACPADRIFTQWHFISCSSMKTGAMRYDAYNVSVATFTATLSRNPSYFVVNLALPNFLFGILELSSYLIPPERPERPVFAVGTLLSLAVGQTFLIRDIPRTSDRVPLSDYMTGLMWICGLITLYHLSTNLAMDSGNGHVKIPQKRSSTKCIEVLSFCLACASFTALHGFLFAVFSNK